MAKYRVIRVGNRVKRVRIDSKPPKKPKQAQPTTKQSGGVTIDDRVIRMMLADPRFLNVAPCLQSGKAKLLAADNSCGRCGRRFSTRRSAFSTLRACLLSLPEGQRAAIKKLLRTDDVRIAAKGKVIAF